MEANQVSTGTVSSATASVRDGVQMIYDKLIAYYCYGMDTTRSAVDKTFSAATHTTAIGLGLAIVCAQMGLIATTSATNALLSSIIYTKNTGQAAIQSAQHVEKAAEQHILRAIEMTSKAARVPGDKVVEHTNSFLDIANAVFDRLLGLTHVQEPVDATIPERVAFLSNRITGGLVHSANNNVIDPVRTKVSDFAQEMQRHLILADYIKQRREWANEKVENLSAGVLEWKQKIEAEAKKYRIAPEEMLVRSIRKTSASLNENFGTLYKQGNELVGDRAQRIENATQFIQQLDKNLEKAENIYQIRDEVIDEAKQKVNEMTQWTASFIPSTQSQTTVSSQQML